MYLGTITFITEEEDTFKKYTESVSKTQMFWGMYYPRWKLFSWGPSHFIRADLVPIRGHPEPLGLATSRTWVKCFLRSCRKHHGWPHALPSQGKNTKLLMLWCGGHPQGLEMKGHSHGWEVVWLLKQMPSTVKTPQIMKCFYGQYLGFIQF